MKGGTRKGREGRGGQTRGGTGEAGGGRSRRDGREKQGHIFLMWIFFLNFFLFSPKIKQISNVILPNVLDITKETRILYSTASSIL